MLKPQLRRPDESLRPGAALPCLALWLLVMLVSPAPAAEPLLEDLHYQLSVLAWQDAARARLTLKSLGPGRFVGEVTGETRGFIRAVTGERRERLETEMVWRDGRLVPLVYREETRRGKKRGLKEYRFDYAQGRLVLWEWHDGKGLLQKWQTYLKGPIYDPLTAFYNYRLGLLGPTHAGGTTVIPGVPYPRPETMEVRLGARTGGGRQAMVSLANPLFGDARGQVFAQVDEALVPQQVWTTVYGITIRGQILPDSVLLPPGLKELQLPGAGTAASR
ncbi:MAG: DUF3108 domain-containing protein [Syntrophobacterales bacterium]|nr:DUF3108 domain-containing protein [Syntrophobacterales bacterium]